MLIKTVKFLVLMKFHFRTRLHGINPSSATKENKQIMLSSVGVTLLHNTKFHYTMSMVSKLHFSLCTHCLALEAKLIHW